MSTEDSKELEGQESAAPPEPTVPSGPTGEDWTRFQEENRTLREQLAEMRGAIDAMRSAPPPPVVQPTADEPFVSDEEIDEAVSEGKGAGAKFKKLVDQAVRKATAQLKATEIDPLRTGGMGALRELSAASLRSEKYYERYKKEIDAVAAQVPPENLGSPQTWRLIYQNVVGSHADEIAAEAAEAALRQSRAEASPSALPGSGGKDKDAGRPAPSREVRDIAGSEGEAALRYKGTDADAMVKRMDIPGVTTWDEYIAMGERLEAENG